MSKFWVREIFESDPFHLIPNGFNACSTNVFNRFWCNLSKYVGATRIFQRVSGISRSRWVCARFLIIFHFLSSRMGIFNVWVMYLVYYFTMWQFQGDILWDTIDTSGFLKVLIISFVRFYGVFVGNLWNIKV